MAGSSPVIPYVFYASFILVVALVAQAESRASAVNALSGGSVSHLSQAENGALAVTAPAEVKALNSIFHKWSISATPNQWNISGEPCSGAAIDSTSLDDVHHNPLIKCDCSYDSNSTCHITQLKVYCLDVVGVIPEELWTLTFLTNLNLGQNHLTGNLSSSIRNLNRMQYLNFGINKLSGEIPKELGELTNLRSLRLQGNSFGGPIPSTFSSLTSLTELMISDLSNGSSSLAFIKDMKSLSTLVLRNNNISDLLPSSIGEYKSLMQLDLSFNNIMGQIPDSLFKLGLLTHLFLGNNKLNGALPAQKVATLLNIDLSYNNLGGSFPSWVSQQNLQLNLDGNNFTTESSNCNTLPSGWNCLHRRFLCNRDPKKRFSLPTDDNKPPSSNRKRTPPIFGYVFGVAALFLLYAFVLSRFLKGRKQKEILDMPKLRQFSYNDLKEATRDFDSANKLGEGGFGPVYKGKLKDGRLVAVKKRAAKSNQGSKEFESEIYALYSTQHRNIVKLYGYCNEGDEKILVLEFLENGSLDRAIGGDRRLVLNWSKRKEILLGIAKGLAYLHEDSGLGIIHRDVKPSNILLDSNYIPKISDFGLAKFLDNTKTHVSTKVAGTRGYMAPEYLHSGQLSEKDDVYSFGVVVQEIVSGTNCRGPNLKESLPSRASSLCAQNSEVELVDPTLSEFNEEEVKHVIKVSVVCTKKDPNARPSMLQVVDLLSHKPVVAADPEPPPGPSREQPDTADDMEID